MTQVNIERHPMKELQENIINLYGEKGKRWLDQLPELTSQMERAHGLSYLKPVKNLSYNYVLSGYQGSQAVILKLSLYDDSLRREATALKAFSGFNVVKILLENKGMLLLEQAIPGVSLKSYFAEKDDEAIRISCECLSQLHQAPIPHSHTFPHINDLLSSFDQNPGLPIHYVLKAKKLRDELIATSASPVLLHGDLHHDNILQHGNNWIVIDPKGVIGEPAYEVGAFIRNPIPELLSDNNALSLINHRIVEFAKILKLPEQRIRDWCYVQAVLSWIWALEDGCDQTSFKQLTELFDFIN